MNMRYLGIVAAIAVCLALAGPAPATSVDYTVFGWAQQFPGPLTPPAGSPWGPTGYPGDTVAFGNYTGTLDLTPGTYVLKINTLNWRIDYTYGGTPEPWPDMNLSFNAARDIYFGQEPAGALQQPGLLRVNYWNDYLSLLAGSTASFTVEGYRVDITPLGLAPVGGSNFSGDNPWAQPPRDVMARFDVTVVPEPVTMAGLMLGIGGLVTYIRKRRTA